MNQKYYIAKIGHMWVTSCYHTIDTINLKTNKEYAQHLNEEQIEWIKENTNAEIIEVSVTIEEKPVEGEGNEVL